MQTLNQLHSFPFLCLFKDQEFQISRECAYINLNKISLKSKLLVVATWGPSLSLRKHILNQIQHIIDRLRTFFTSRLQSCLVPSPPPELKCALPLPW